MGKHDSKTKYLGPAACILVVILALVIFLSMEEDTPAPEEVAPQAEKTKTPEVDLHAERVARRERRRELAEAREAEAETPEAPSEVEEEDEGPRSRIEVRIIPTLNGKDAPWIRYYIENPSIEFAHGAEKEGETEAWDLLEDNDYEVFSVDLDAIEKIHSLKLLLAGYTYREFINDEGETEYEHFYPEPSVDGPTRLFKDLVAKEGVFDLGEVRIDVSYLLPADSALFIMQLNHGSRESFDDANITMRVKSESVVLDTFDCEFHVSPDSEGFAYTVFNIANDEDAINQRVLTPKEIEKLQIEVINDHGSLIFQRRRGCAYDFGSATLGGAIVDFRYKVNLPDFLSFGEETLVKKDSLVIGSELASSWFNFQNRFKNGSVIEEFDWLNYQGEGLFTERVWIPSGFYAWGVRTRFFRSWSGYEFPLNEKLNIRDGDYIPIEREFEVGENFTILAFAREGKFISDEDLDFELYGETMSYWDSRDSKVALKDFKSLTAFKKVYYDGSFSLDEGCLMAFASTDEATPYFFATKAYAPIVVAVGAGKHFQVVDFTRKWSETVVEEEVEEDNKHEVVVSVDFNGVKIPDGTSFEFYTYDENNVSSLQREVQGGALEHRFERDPALESQVFILNENLFLGYTSSSIAEVFKIKAGDQSRAFTIKLKKPEFVVSKETDFQIRYVCGDTALASADGKIPASGAVFRGDERKKLKIDWGRTERVSAGEFVVSYPVRTLLTLGTQPFERFSSFWVQSGTWRFSASKAGVYSLPEADNVNWNLDEGNWNLDENGVPWPTAAEDFLWGMPHGSKKAVQFFQVVFMHETDWTEDEEGNWIEVVDNKEPHKFKVDYLPTIVTFDGQLGGYEWSFLLDDRVLYHSNLKAGMVRALPPGDYSWSVRDDWQDIPLDVVVTIPNAPTHTVTIPGNDLLSKGGEVHFRLDAASQDFLVDGEVIAGIAYSILGRANLSQKTESSDYRRDNAIYPLRIVDKELIVSGLPIGKTLYLQLFCKKDGKHYMAAPVKMKLSKEAKTLDLPSFIESWGYSNLPHLGDAPVEETGFYAPDYDHLFVVEFHLNGKVIAPEIGLERNKEHVCWIWSAKKPTGEPLLKLRCTAGPQRITWEEDAKERIKPVVELLRAQE